MQGIDEFFMFVLHFNCHNELKSSVCIPSKWSFAHLGQVPGRPQGGRHGMVFAFRAAIQSSPVTVHPSSASTVSPTLIIGDYRRSPAVLRVFQPLHIDFASEQLDAASSRRKWLFSRVTYFRIICIHIYVILLTWTAIGTMIRRDARQRTVCYY